MPSSRLLGVVALSAVALAAISFAAVDVIIADASGCSGAGGTCTDSLPAGAVLFAIIGTLALLASVLPAITWFIRTIHHPRHDADIEPMRMAIARTRFDEDEL